MPLLPDMLACMQAPQRVGVRSPLRRAAACLTQHPKPSSSSLAATLKVSALPVVSESGVLLDVYSRADITCLCRGNAYNRLQWEDVTVGSPAARLTARRAEGMGLVGPMRVVVVVGTGALCTCVALWAAAHHMRPAA